MKPKTWTIAIVLLAGLAVRGDDRPAKIHRIFVPIVKADGKSRAEMLQMTEVIIKGIEQFGSGKVVATPDEADLILEATLKPVVRPGR